MKKLFILLLSVFILNAGSLFAQCEAYFYQGGTTEVPGGFRVELLNASAAFNNAGDSVDIVSYYWEIPDDISGIASNGMEDNMNQNPVFAESGFYPVYLQIESASGCTDDIIDTIVVEGSDPCENFNATAEIEHESAIGAQDGSITLSVEGGEAPYSYYWSGNNPGNSLTGLSSGYYYYIVEDANGCVKTDTIYIETLDPNVYSLALQVEPYDTETGFCNGGAYFNIEGGAYPYTLEVIAENGDVIPNDDLYVYGLCPGTYTASVTDGNNMTESVTFIIGEYNPIDTLININVNTTLTEINQCTGTAEFLISGGFEPYELHMSNEANEELLIENNVAENLCEGSYFLSVTDSLGHHRDYTFEIESTDTSSNEIIITDTLSNEIDTCFNFTADDAYVQEVYANNSGTITVDWVVFSEDGDSALVTNNYDVNESGYYVVWLYINCENGAKIYIGFSDIVEITEDIILETDNISLLKTKVFPNPFNQEINIEFKDESFKQISIININGQVIDIFDTNELNYRVDASKYSSGLYLINIKTNSQTQTLKLVK